MIITKNEEVVVDSQMILSFMVDYYTKEITVFYIDEKTEEEMTLTAECYNWTSDDTEPQEGRIDIHGCGVGLWLNCVGNYWNVTTKKLIEDEPQEVTT